jgi:hypothetical protein
VNSSVCTPMILRAPANAPPFWIARDRKKKPRYCFHPIVSILRKISILAMGMLAMSDAAVAGDIVVGREVILKDEVYGAYVIQPNAITRTRDGGYVIAGRIFANQSAWAVRTDPQGKVLWRHDTLIRDKLPIGQGAEFTGATEMDDGSFLLCGNMPSASSSPALLVHLDAAGQGISEELVSPKDRDGAEVFSARIDQCLRWGDGAVIIGRVRLAFPPVPPSPRRDSKGYYWVLKVDPKGDIVWERLIPPEIDNVIDGVGSALIATDGTLVFTGHRNQKTELLRKGMTGEVLAIRQFPHRYLLVKSLVPDNRLQIFGGNRDDIQELLTLDDQLSTQEQVRGRHLPAFIPHDVYRMRDQSLVLFGSGLHTAFPRFSSRVVSLTPALEAESYIDLLHKPFVDVGFVKAATPTGTPGEFATVRQLQKDAPGIEAQVGAAIDFIRISFLSDEK